MRMRERLVFRGERRGGHMRNHETGVDAALLHQEWRQAREISIHQQRDTPFGERADLGNGERKIVRSEGDRLGVKITPESTATSSSASTKMSGLSDTAFDSV